MKKKGFIALGVAGLLALSITVPEVSAFAMSALSVFRVADAKTITVTIDDIANVSAYFKEHEGEYKAGHKDVGLETDSGIETFWQSFEEEFGDVQELASAEEFTAFPVKLPEIENIAPPGIASIQFREQNFTTNDGEEVAVSFSPLFFSIGDAWVYVATQGFNENFSDEAKQKIKDHILELPFLSENLCAQIAGIPLDTKDIYLPVIEGISRSVDIGGETGYIYSSSDLSMIMDSLPEEAAWEMPDEEDPIDIDMTTVVWVNDGVLNILAAHMPEAELVQLARSVSR